MDLTAALWIFVASLAFVLAGDALVLRFVRAVRLPTRAKGSALRFGVLMLLFALACSGVALYEVVA